MQCTDLWHADRVHAHAALRTSWRTVDERWQKRVGKDGMTRWDRGVWGGVGVDWGGGNGVLRPLDPTGKLYTHVEVNEEGGGGGGEEGREYSNSCSN